MSRAGRIREGPGNQVGAVNIQIPNAKRVDKNRDSSLMRIASATGMYDVSRTPQRTLLVYIGIIADLSRKCGAGLPGFLHAAGNIVDPLSQVVDGLRDDQLILFHGLHVFFGAAE